MFSTAPVVYAVGDEYQIMFYVRCTAYAKVVIGGREFKDSVCGVMRSAKGMRRVRVPRSLLDECGEYTVVTQNLLARVAYNPKIIKTTENKYKFRPVKSGTAVRAFMTGDAHGDIENVIKSAKSFGAFDFLILNGDMPNKCDRVRDFETPHNVAARLTGGEIPAIFAKGNHENRGAAAEIFHNFFPVGSGDTLFYTFRLGGIWGLVLDCGEDKEDDNAEYGGSADFSQYRRQQTEFIKRIIADSENEYEAPGVEHRIVVSHVPFIRDMGKLFTIEEKTFSEWTKLLGTIKPEAIFSAHLHRYEIMRNGSEYARFPSPCPTVVGTFRRDNCLGGSGITFDKDGITVDFTTSEGKTVLSEKI